MNAKRIGLGEPVPAVPQPTRVVADLALAHEIQAALDGVGGDGDGGGGGARGEGLTYREAGALYGVSRTTIGRHVSLARLAPDIHRIVAGLTTTTAAEPIDRKKLEWVAEAKEWPEQRVRFQKVVDEAYKAEPAPIARAVANAIKLRDDVKAKRSTLKRIAAAREVSIDEVREHLMPARLAPAIRDVVLRMTTVTVSPFVTEEKLRFIARKRDLREQRRMYERLVAGQLRSTRAKAEAAGESRRPGTSAAGAAADDEQRSVRLPGRPPTLEKVPVPGIRHLHWREAV
jgi:hypothetical protein